MKKLIHNTIDDRGRLRCDNPVCRYVLPERKKFDTNLIGFPCPKCGCSMLTQRDFLDSERLVARIAWINKWFGWLGTEEPEGRAYGVRTHNGIAEIVKDGDNSPVR